MRSQKVTAEPSAKVSVEESREISTLEQGAEEGTEATVVPLRTSIILQKKQKGQKGAGEAGEVAST